MAEKIVTHCPFCHKPHTVTISQFESVEPLDFTPRPYAKTESVFSDSIRYATWLTLGSAATWAALAMADLNNPPYWLAPISGLGITLVIEWGKIWVNRPKVLPEPKVKPTSIKVQMEESLPSGKRYLLAELEETITMDDLAIVAQADTFSRSAVCKAGLSQNKWHKVKAEFLRLNLCYPLPNNANGYGLTLRGKALLRQVNALPSPS